MTGIKVVAFDLQGTLSCNMFGDEFWMELLPRLHADYKNISLKQSRDELGVFFKRIGRYDKRYYSMDYWRRRLKIDIPFTQLMMLMKNKPRFYADSCALLKSLKGKRLVLISSTSKEFIHAELGRNSRYFSSVYSSIDDFGIAGKPPRLYKRICKELHVTPSEMLYIGNDKVMDIDNAKAAGLKTYYFDNNMPRKRLIEDIKEIIVNKHCRKRNKYLL